MGIYLSTSKLSIYDTQNEVIYSVMHASFCGDVVSDSFNETSRDEDNILDQINKSKHFRFIGMMILIRYNIIRKCILTLQQH